MDSVSTQFDITIYGTLASQGSRKGSTRESFEVPESPPHSHAFLMSDNIYFILYKQFLADNTGMDFDQYIIDQNTKSETHYEK